MRVLIGIGVVLVVAALAALAYSRATGKDLREIAKDVQKDVQGVDVNEIGKRVNEGVASVEATVAAKIDEIRGTAVDVEAAAKDKLASAEAVPA